MASQFSAQKPVPRKVSSQYSSQAILPLPQATPTRVIPPPPRATPIQAILPLPQGRPTQAIPHPLPATPTQVVPPLPQIPLPLPAAPIQVTPLLPQGRPTQVIPPPLPASPAQMIPLPPQATLFQATPPLPQGRPTQVILTPPSAGDISKRIQPRVKRQLKIPIDMFPDEVLLAIFDFHVVAQRKSAHTPFSQVATKKGTEAWLSLTHVCRRWRNVVFGSPCRLNLHLACTPGTRAIDTLDVWPDLCLLIRGSMSSVSSMDNIIAVLGRGNRICTIKLWELASWQLDKVSAAMQKPFPGMSNLQLRTSDKSAPVVPDSFLGGSAPYLRHLELERIPFPGLPKLLLSAIHLVTLRLHNIPHSGYFSPEAMSTCLSVLSSLKEICLEFESPLSRPDWESRRPPTPTRVVLPALTYFGFKGVSEYLGDLVALIDAPRLNYLYIVFFNQIDFDTPQLAQFISRTPRLKAPHEAHVVFDNPTVLVELLSRTSAFGYGDLNVKISCRELDWQLSSLAQVCTLSLPPLSTVESLYTERPHSQLDWKHNVEDIQWLEFLRPFVAVRSLYLSWEFAPGVASALQELVGGRVTEVLPALGCIFFGGRHPLGPVRETIGQFVAARQLSGHPIVISDW